MVLLSSSENCARHSFFLSFSLAVDVLAENKSSDERASFVRGDGDLVAGQSSHCLQEPKYYSGDQGFDWRSKLSGKIIIQAVITSH